MDNKMIRATMESKIVKEAMNNKILRETLIIVLLLIVIMFTMGILFYDSTPASNEKIISVKYETDQSVNEVIAEIKENSAVQSEESSSLLKSYSVNANDLNFYASDNSYESGKKDPFAENSETIEQTITTTFKGADANNSQSKKQFTENNSNTQKNVEKNNSINKITNSVKNSEKKSTQKNTNSVKKESSSTTGTFFEKENSK